MLLSFAVPLCDPSVKGLRCQMEGCVPSFGPICVELLHQMGLCSVFEAHGLFLCGEFLNMRSEAAAEMKFFTHTEAPLPG